MKTDLSLLNRRFPIACTVLACLLSLTACQSSEAKTDNKPENNMATVLHVRADADPAKSNGRSERTAFTTIQQTLDLVEPGQTVLIHPGVYFEKLVLKKAGTADAPITIKADRVAKNRVILTGADQAIRTHKQTWERVDDQLLLYRTPMDHRPTRVLADHVDLLAYPNLADLKAFTYLKSDYPGHEHGFAWQPQEKMLYVRLRADRKYNTSTNPNDLTMAVSPPPSEDTFGRFPTYDAYQNLHLNITGPAHVIIDGLTFETPGVTGIYTQADQVVVRNCWFYGCRAGVTGAALNVIGQTTRHVTVEQCFYTQFPAYTDEEQTIYKHIESQKNKPQHYQRIMHWQRKGNYPPGDGVGRQWGYEVGLTMYMGENWIIRNNLVTDSFEAISAFGASQSVNALITGNCFQRICDNAVEAENHSKNMVVAGNLIIDTYEPFSWQPNNGNPLPGPVYIHDNIVWQTPRDLNMWTTAGNWPGILKIGGKDRNWKKVSDTPRRLVIPGGFWFAHNTIIRKRGRILTWLNSEDWPLDGVHIFNNIFATWRLATSKAMPALKDMTLDHNLIWPTMTYEPDTTTVDESFAQAAGPNGSWYPQIYVPSDWKNPLPPAIKMPRGLMDRRANEQHPAIPSVMPLRKQVGALSFPDQPIGPIVD